MPAHPLLFLVVMPRGSRNGSSNHKQEMCLDIERRRNALANFSRGGFVNGVDGDELSSMQKRATAVRLHARTMRFGDDEPQLMRAASSCRRCARRASVDLDRQPLDIKPVAAIGDGEARPAQSIDTKHQIIA